MSHITTLPVLAIEGQTVLSSVSEMVQVGVWSWDNRVGTEGSVAEDFYIEMVNHPKMCHRNWTEVQTVGCINFCRGNILHRSFSRMWTKEFTKPENSQHDLQSQAVVEEIILHHGYDESVFIICTLHEHIAQRSKLGFQSSPLRLIPSSCGQSPLQPGPDVHTQS